MSAYAAAYIATFGGRIVLEECKLREPPVTIDVFAVDGNHDRPEVAPADDATEKFGHMCMRTLFWHALLGRVALGSIG